MICTKFKMCSPAISNGFGIFLSIPLIYWNTADLVLHDIEITCLKEFLVTYKMIRTHRVQDIVSVWYMAARKLYVVIDRQVKIWSCTMPCKNWHLHFVTRLCLHTFGFPIVNFPWLSGDVPRLPSYGIYISQLVRYARCCTSVFDSHS